MNDIEGRSILGGPALPSRETLRPSPTSRPKPSTLVVRLDRLARRGRLLADPVAVIVDADSDTPPLDVLARMVVVRRRIRACGGDLVLVAGPATVNLLHRLGLQNSIPCYDNIEAGARALDHNRAVELHPT